MPAKTAIVLQLNTIDELFVAPAANPFSLREVEILGQAGIDVAQKQLLRAWPRRPRAVQLVIELPDERLTPVLAADTQAALQRYMATRIDANRMERRLTVRLALRQMAGAFVAILIALALIAFLALDPLGLLPPFLRGVLVVLVLYACSVLSFDALWSLVFDWVPFVQNNAVFRAMAAMQVSVETSGN